MTDSPETIEETVDAVAAARGGARRLNIIQVVPHVGNEASGPSYTCVRLSQTLAAGGHDVSLLSLIDGLTPSCGSFRHEVFPRSKFLPSLWRSPRLYDALLGQVRNADVVHNNGLWAMPNVYSGWAARSAAKPFVVSPRGTFSGWAWQKSRLRKSLFWRTAQGPVVARAAMLHATGEPEYLDIRARGFRQPVCVIPNGIDVPEAVPGTPRAGRRRLLFLGRIHPVKGVDNLLRAWAALAARHPDWELEIVGPDNDGHLDEMRSLAASLGVERVAFGGPLFGAEKPVAYRRADLYVLPTRSENFGVTVAEALACGVPAVVTKAAPWAGLVEKGTGWWIDVGVDPLVDCLDRAMGCSPERLAEMGTAGRRWMKEEFSWQGVAAAMSDCYAWLLGEAPRPACVRID